MSTLRDDEIQTIEAGKRFDPQADADGDDTDGTDGDSDAAVITGSGERVGAGVRTTGSDKGESSDE